MLDDTTILTLDNAITMLACTLNLSFRRRLAQALDLLSSSEPEVVLAAAREAEQMRAERGQSWAQILAGPDREHLPIEVEKTVLAALASKERSAVNGGCPRRGRPRDE
jgi:hypothetical protein